jgi:hypothetical protein
MEGEEAEEAERRRGDKTADFWGIDRVEIEILNFGSNQACFTQNFIQATFDKTRMNTRKVDKVEIEAGLGSGCDHEEWDNSQRDWAIPEKAAYHENEKEVETVEELFVVGVLHLAHPAKLIHPKVNLVVGLWHISFMPSAQPKDNLVTFLQRAFGRR